MAGHGVQGGRTPGGGAWRHRSIVWAVAAVMLAPAAPAAADSISVTFGPRHPTGVTPIRFQTTWATTSTDATVTVSVEEPSRRRCPKSPAADRGVTVIDAARARSYPRARSKPHAFEHGRYLVCAWLAGPAKTLASRHVRLTVSNPDKLSITAPSTVLDGTSSTISFSGVADVPHPVVVLKRTPGATGRCGSKPTADSGQALSRGSPAPGTLGVFSGSALAALGSGPSGAVDAARPGAYTLCAWLVDGDGSPDIPLAAPASAPVTLTAPTGTLAYSMPELVSVGHSFGLVTRYDTRATDVSMYVDLKPLPSSGPLCAASHAGDSGAVKLVVSHEPGRKITTPVTLGAGGAYVACAWLEWPGGTIDGPFAGRVVVERPHQHARFWCGTTSQRLRPAQIHHSSCPVSFETIDGQVVYLSYWAQFTCTAPRRRTSHKIYQTSFPVFGMSSSSSFSGHYDQGNDEAAVSARLKRKRGHGTLRESYRSGGFSCASGAVGFKVRSA